MSHKRQRQLDTAVAAVRGRYGPWALVKGRPSAPVPHIPTGFPALDRALGIGGLPRGRLCEILGPATSGKTTLALKLLAGAQSAGGRVGYVDQALYFDADYAHRCSLDLSRLVVGTPHDCREALAMVESLVRSGSLAALVVDSPDFFWSDPTSASLLSATLDRLPAPLARSGTVLLFVHESLAAGPPAIAHQAAVRLQVIRDGWIVRHGDVRGYEARVGILKNQLGPSGRTVAIAVEFNGTVHGDGL